MVQDSELCFSALEEESVFTLDSFIPFIPFIEHLLRAILCAKCWGNSNVRQTQSLTSQNLHSGEGETTKNHTDKCNVLNL